MGRASGFMRSLLCNASGGASRGMRVLGLVPFGAAVYWSQDSRCAPQPPKLSPTELHPNVVVLQSRAIQVLLSGIRDKETTNAKFMDCADRLFRILAEESLAQLDSVTPITVVSQCGVAAGYASPQLDSVCAVAILRSGDALLQAYHQISRGAISKGNLLIQRDEKTKKPRLFICQLPAEISNKRLLLLDPMLATGGSAKLAIQLLIDKGVPQEHIIFVNMVCTPDGLSALAAAYPAVKVVTCAVDDGLTSGKFVRPGLGDFGDRYYNTVEIETPTFMGGDFDIPVASFSQKADWRDKYYADNQE